MGLNLKKAAVVAKRIPLIPLYLLGATAMTIWALFLTGEGRRPTSMLKLGALFGLSAVTGVAGAAFYAATTGAVMTGGLLLTGAAAGLVGGPIVLSLGVSCYLALTMIQDDIRDAFRGLDKQASAAPATAAAPAVASTPALAPGFGAAATAAAATANTPKGTTPTPAP